jgi:hypothetical protein
MEHKAAAKYHHRRQYLTKYTHGFGEKADTALTARGATTSAVIHYKAILDTWGLTCVPTASSE